TPFTVLAAPPPFPLQCAIARRAAARCSGACLLPVAQRWGGGPRSGGGAARLRLGAHPEMRYLSPMTDKRELRAAMRAHRKRLAHENPRAAEQVVLNLPDLLETMFETDVSFAEEQKHRRFTAAVYKAQGSELDAMPLALALQARDVDLALPVAVARDAPLEFRRWRPRDPLEIDAAGVPAPLPLAEVVSPDVIFVPCLA